MVNRVWIGGGDNQASNPNDWSPTGVPQPGDSLSIVNDSTISIQGNVLQGGTLSVLPTSSALGSNVTLNLSDFANVTETSDLNTVVNVAGLDRFVFAGGILGQTNIHLSNFSLLLANISTGYGFTTTISGSPFSLVDFSGTNYESGSTTTIDANVVGSGEFVLAVGGLTAVQNSGANLEFGGLVSPRQTVDITGAQVNQRGFIVVEQSSLKIDQPHLFFGTINLHDYGFADLANLAQADSWSYKNDLLSIQNASGQMIDLVHVVSDAASTGNVHGLSLSMTTAGDVIISPGTDFQGHIGSATT